MKINPSEKSHHVLQYKYAQLLRRLSYSTSSHQKLNSLLFLSSVERKNKTNPQPKKSKINIIQCRFQS